MMRFMPLLDHFHPPLSERRHWEAVHTRWASALADHLNEEWLPDRYFAEPQVSLGTQMQIDVATFEEAGDSAPGPPGPNGAATATRTWTAPPATWTVPARFPDTFAVNVYQTETGPKLVGAIELVSPANKDRPETRGAFVAKCGGNVGQSVGVIMLDAVTVRRFNLHNELMQLLHCGPDVRFRDDVFLYAAAYRPVRDDDDQRIEIWSTPLEIGMPLPTLPLFLGPNLVVPVDFEAAYTEACERLRLR